MSQGAGAIAHSLIKAVKSGDIASVLGMFHPDCVAHEAESLPYGGEWKGLDGFQSLLAAINSSIALEIRDYKVVADDDFAAMRADCTFTFHKSGRTLDMPVVELYTVRDGLIVRCDIFYKDTALVNEVAGASQ